MESWESSTSPVTPTHIEFGGSSTVSNNPAVVIVTDQGTSSTVKPVTITSHISIQPKNRMFTLENCSSADCCSGRVHCPLCASEKTLPLIIDDVRCHVGEVHLKNSMIVKEWLVMVCYLNCTNNAHFHCPYCPELVAFQPNRSQFTEHLRSSHTMKRLTNYMRLKKNGSKSQGDCLWEMQYMPINMISRDRRAALANELPFLHMSIVCSLTDLDVRRCPPSCCNRFHCPLCPEETFHPCTAKKMVHHLETTHGRFGLKLGDLQVLKCRLDCLDNRTKIGQAHFHCPLCPVRLLYPTRFFPHIEAHIKGTSKTRRAHKELMSVAYDTGTIDLSNLGLTAEEIQKLSSLGIEKSEILMSQDASGGENNDAKMECGSAVDPISTGPGWIQTHVDENLYMSPGDEPVKTDHSIPTQWTDIVQTDYAGHYENKQNVFEVHQHVDNQLVVGQDVGNQYVVEQEVFAQNVGSQEVVDHDVANQEVVEQEVVQHDVDNQGVVGEVDGWLVLRQEEVPEEQNIPTTSNHDTMEQEVNIHHVIVNTQILRSLAIPLERLCGLLCQGFGVTCEIYLDQVNFSGTSDSVHMVQTAIHHMTNDLSIGSEKINDIIQQVQQGLGYQPMAAQVSPKQGLWPRKHINIQSASASPSSAKRFKVDGSANDSSVRASRRLKDKKETRRQTKPGKSVESAKNKSASLAKSTGAETTKSKGASLDIEANELNVKSTLHSENISSNDMSTQSNAMSRHGDDGTGAGGPSTSSVVPDHPEYILLELTGKAGETCPICHKAQCSSRPDLLMHILSSNCLYKSSIRRSHLSTDLRTQVDRMSKCVSIKCYICEKEFGSLLQTKVHYALMVCKPRQKKNPYNIPKDEKTGKYFCDLCGFVAAIPHKVVVHQQRKHMQKIIPCGLCGKKFSTDKFVQIHMERQHMDQAKSMCEHCGKTFYNKYMQRHYNDVHNPNYIRSNRRPNAMPLKCPLCKYQTVYLADLQRHIKRMHATRAFECQQCMAQFAFQGDLNNHIKLVHEDTEGRQVVQCEICRKDMLQRNLKLHYKQVHESCSYYSCEVCGKQLQCRFSYLYHIETHKKPADRLYKFRCSECGSGFMTRSVLQDHLNTHTGLRPYVCSICSKTFRQRSVYHKHLEVHKQVSYMCAFCGQVFSSKQSVEEHKAMTHPSSELLTYSRLSTECECGQGFDSDQMLRKHQESCQLAMVMQATTTAQDVEHMQEIDGYASNTEHAVLSHGHDLTMSTGVLAPEEVLALMEQHCNDNNTREIIQMDDGTFVVVKEVSSAVDDEEKEPNREVVELMDNSFVSSSFKSEDDSQVAIEAGLSFECGHCGNYFESMEEAQQHIEESHSQAMEVGHYINA